MNMMDIKIKSLMATRAWLIAAGFLVGLTSCSSAISEPQMAETDLCNSPEISSLATPKGACRVELIRYREAGQASRNATLASIPAGLTVNWDVIQSRALYFLKVPGVGVVSLGESFS